MDGHEELCKSIGYLAVNYTPDRESWDDVYTNTHGWVLDLLVQHFFPGHTWLAATDVRESGDPLPPFVAVRHDVIIRKQEWSGFFLARI